MIQTAAQPPWLCTEPAWDAAACTCSQNGFTYPDGQRALM